MEILKQQYRLVQGSREVLLDFCTSIKPEDLVKENESFNNSSIAELLLHNANTYIFWLKRFANKEEMEYFKTEDVTGIDEVGKAFAEADLEVERFLNSHSDPAAPIEGEIFWLKKNMTFTVLELFTHIITHEFHHKGQIMTMARMMAYTPLDADIIRF
ncbi:MAG: DinB family protein [Ignavibacteria bacterium]|nr:DinB family protein [Ignavibacteria bacterium]